MNTPTHTALLNAAADVVAEHGFERATTRRIAARAGVNEVTLFRLFGSKRALIEAVLSEETRLLETEASLYSGDVEADLTRLVTAFTNLIRDRGPLLVAAYVEAQHQPEFAQLLAHQAQALQRVADLIAQYQQRGHLRPEPAQVAMGALIGPLVFAALASHALPDLELLPDPAAHVRAYLAGRHIHDGQTMPHDLLPQGGTL